MICFGVAVSTRHPSVPAWTASAGALAHACDTRSRLEGDLSEPHLESAEIRIRPRAQRACLVHCPRESSGPPWPCASKDATRPDHPGHLRCVTLTAVIRTLGSPALSALNSSTVKGRRQQIYGLIDSKKIESIRALACFLAISCKCSKSGCFLPCQRGGAASPPAGERRRSRGGVLSRGPGLCSGGCGLADRCVAVSRSRRARLLPPDIESSIRFAQSALPYSGSSIRQAPSTCTTMSRARSPLAPTISTTARSSPVSRTTMSLDVAPSALPMLIISMGL
jgi:hypothetical protein